MSDEHVCEHCGKALNPERMVWLEHDLSSGTWHKEGEVPPESSQGLFAFGTACAKKVLAGTAPKHWSNP